VLLDPNLCRMSGRLPDVYVQQSVRGGPGLRRSNLSGVHVRRSVRAERPVSGNTFRLSVYVHPGLGLRRRRNVRVRGLLTRQCQPLHGWTRWKLSERTSVRQRRMRRVLVVRGLQLRIRVAGAAPRPRLRRRRLHRLHVERRVRRWARVRRRDVRHLRDQRAVRTERAMQQRLLHVFLRRAVRHGATLRGWRLRRDVNDAPAMRGPKSARPNARCGSREVGSRCASAGLRALR
jgi:hypothetical protein